MAAGRAVILPDIPALREVLPSAAGYYFRRGDATALAAALAAALADPNRAERAERGLALVAPHTYTARAERILALAATVAQKYGSIST
jgi:glycosyltransferase involved in cell wall biosynthesis